MTIAASVFDVCRNEKSSTWADPLNCFENVGEIFNRNSLKTVFWFTFNAKQQQRQSRCWLNADVVLFFFLNEIQGGCYLFFAIVYPLYRWNEFTNGISFLKQLLSMDVMDSRDSQPDDPPICYPPRPLPAPPPAQISGCNFLRRQLLWLTAWQHISQ